MLLYFKTNVCKDVFVVNILAISIVSSIPVLLQYNMHKDVFINNILTISVFVFYILNIKL